MKLHCSEPWRALKLTGDFRHRRQIRRDRILTLTFWAVVWALILSLVVILGFLICDTLSLLQPFR